MNNNKDRAKGHTELHSSKHRGTGSGMTRRDVITAAGAGIAAAWLPLFRITPASASACDIPPAFPAGIPLYQQAWQNWSEEITVDALWTCAPRTADDVVTIANWARAQGYQVRARGCAHGWSPLTITRDSDCATRVVLVDCTQCLNAMQIVTPAPGQSAVKAGAGAILEVLLAFLEQHGLGVQTHPATGHITVGGMLAIDGHGASLPAAGETPTPGFTYGSLSNLILSLTAVVWDADAQSYVLRTFARSHPNCAALTVHLGRAFITEVTLQVGALQNVRCVSFTNVTADELFAAPGSQCRTFQSYVEQSGRAEAIWYPFTDRPWMKVWSVAPTQPLLSRKVTDPYNYPFSDNIPQPVADLAQSLVSGNAQSTPLFGTTMLAVTEAGLAATASQDIWGASKNTQLYIKATTLRARETGYPVITRRSNIQRVIHEYKVFHDQLVEQYRARGLYPMNMPVEIRCSGLDYVADVQLAHAKPPILSSLLARDDHPEWDVAIWINMLCLVGTPGSDAFYSDMQDFFISNYSGDYAALRPEWSKGWAHTDTAAYANTTMLQTVIPNWFRDGRPAGQRWDDAIAILNTLDPNHVFSNVFLDGFMV